MKSILLFLILILTMGVAQAAPVWVVTKTTKVDVNSDPSFVFTYTKDDVVKRVEVMAFDPSLTAANLNEHAYAMIAKIDAFDALQMDLPDGDLKPVAPPAPNPTIAPALQALMDALKDAKSKETLLANKVPGATQQAVTDAYAVITTMLKDHPELADTYAKLLKQYV